MMGVPNRPSWMRLPSIVNGAVDAMQEGVRASQDLIDKWQGQENSDEIDQYFKKKYGMSYGEMKARLMALEKDVAPIISSYGQTLDRIRRLEIEAQNTRALERRVSTVEKKVDGFNTAIQKIIAGNRTFQLAVNAKLAALSGALKALAASLPWLVKSIVLSIIASAVLNSLIDLGMGLLVKSGKIDLSPLLAKIQKATDDARAAATIAVKAEGKADKAGAKADKALSEIEWVTQNALSAMKRLEALIKERTSTLSNSLSKALSRIDILERAGEQLYKLQFQALDKIDNLERYWIPVLQAKIEEGQVLLKQLTATVDKLKTDVLRELAKLKPLVNKIPKILGDIAVFAVQVGAIWVAINAIKALFGKLKPGGSVVNNYYYTTNNYTQPDLALLKKIDATTTTNLGVSNATYSLNQTMNTKLGDQIFGKGGKAIGIGGKLVSGFNWLIVDRAMNMLTLAVTIHNAAMLSGNIIATLTQAMQNVVDLIGIKDDQDNQVQVSSLINNSITGFVKSVVGKENYDYWIKQWNYYNRILTTGANLFNSLLSMGDTIVNALQVISGQSAKLANACRLWGVVGENAYSLMNPNPNFNNPLLVKLESLNDAASTVEQVSQEPLNVKSAKEQLEADSAAFADSLAQKPNSKQGKQLPEAEKEKEAFDAGKDASKGKDLDPEDRMEDDS